MTVIGTEVSICHWYRLANRRHAPGSPVGASSAFAALAMVAERVRSVEPAATWVSAGMSGDYEEAIAAGATHLRIGTAVTGPRPT